MQTTEEIINGIFEKQKLLGLSNQQLADAANIPKTTLDRIKRKETQSPAMQTVLDLAAAVGYQIGGDDKPKEGSMEYMVRLYEDRIARLRSHYNMLLAEKGRWINYLLYVIGGLLLTDFLMVVLLIIIILL